MFRNARLILPVLASLLAVACEVEPEPDPNPLEVVPQTGSFSLPCLSAPVHVVRTEMAVPHVYAETREDLACALGFVMARDRFFQMDLISRNGLGTLGELLGELGMESDIGIRSRGGAQIAQSLLDAATPAERA